jgi:cysteine desulfurase
MPAASIYLDHNATAPILPEVADAVRAAALRYRGNPASPHQAGREARRALEAARWQIGEILGARTAGMHADQVIFTSGGTEANNLALGGLLPRGDHHLAPPLSLQPRPPAGGRTSAMDARLRDDPRAEPGAGEAPARTAIVGEYRSAALLARRSLLISALEHPSIARTAERLAAEGVLVDMLGASADGVVRLEELERRLTAPLDLASVMLASNETGVIQPVADIAAMCRARGVLTHTDATQAVGKIPVSFQELGVDALTATAHKFHGPLGIGVLIVRHGVALHPELWGGFQQAGLRPGSESVALAVGMQAALEAWRREAGERFERMTALRVHFERTIRAGDPSAVVVGAGAPRLPHTSNIALVGLERQALVMALDVEGVACSTGSACASGSSEPSPALVAMGLPEAVISSSVRFSLGAATTLEEVDEAARRILSVCKRLRRAI